MTRDLPLTERDHPDSQQLDSLSPLAIVRLMNRQDRLVVDAVERVADAIAESISIVTERLRCSGRLIYCGAGTSGRLGVLDASECPPTFSSPPEMVVGVIAGGRSALTRAIEGAEDDAEAAIADLQSLGLTARDVVVGIATSGSTPYVVSAIQYANSFGAATIGIACTEGAMLEQHARCMICPLVGPEILSGSTRLKAGTATKMILNMISTGAMVGLGKTYGNRMVDLKPSNAKLKRRSIRLVSDIAGVDTETATTLLEECGGEVKTAIVMHAASCSPENARETLAASDGQLRRALNTCSSGLPPDRS
ncbi:MAG: N-acetylmuramic acid 6-phosphate etherase [Planctomycetota bacterium]